MKIDMLYIFYRKAFIFGNRLLVKSFRKYIKIKSILGKYINTSNIILPFSLSKVLSRIINYMIDHCGPLLRLQIFSTLGHIIRNEPFKRCCFFEMMLDKHCRGCKWRLPYWFMWDLRIFNILCDPISIIDFCKCWASILKEPCVRQNKDCHHQLWYCL